MSKICKFFVKGNCRDGEKCKFKHEEGICRNYFFDECKNENCKFKHTSKLEVKKDIDSKREFDGKKENRHRRKVKNTETFEPSHKLPDMRVLVANCNKETYQKYRITEIEILNRLINFKLSTYSPNKFINI